MSRKRATRCKGGVRKVVSRRSRRKGGVGEVSRRRRRKGGAWKIVSRRRCCKSYGGGENYYYVENEVIDVFKNAEWKIEDSSEPRTGDNTIIYRRSASKIIPECLNYKNTIYDVTCTILFVKRVNKDTSNSQYVDKSNKNKTYVKRGKVDLWWPETTNSWNHIFASKTRTCDIDSIVKKDDKYNVTFKKHVFWKKSYTLVMNEVDKKPFDYILNNGVSRQELHCNFY